MDQVEGKKTQALLQQEISGWLSHGRPNVFITYSFCEPVSYDVAAKVFGTHAHKLKREFFGRNSKRRLFMVPVIEKYHKGSSYGALLKSEEGIHIHCLMRLPDNPMDHMDVIRNLWLQSDRRCGDPLVYCPDSDAWFMELTTQEKKEVFMSYATKTCVDDSQAVLWKFVSFGR